MCPRTLVSLGNNAARRGALVAPSAIPCSLFPLISRIHLSLFFSDWNAPSSRSLCSLSSTLQRTQPSVKFLFLQDWQNRESFLQRLRTLVPGHLSSHSARSSDGLFAPLALLVTLSLQPPVQALGRFPASGAPWSSAMPPSLGRGRITTTTTTNVKRILPRLNHSTLQCRSTSCYALSIFQAKIKTICVW